MKDFIRLLRLFKPYLGWMLLGSLLSLITVVANVTLLGISGWFITMMALAGLAGVSTDYFTPAAIIRGAAIARTAGRYGERLVTHEATFRLIAELRVWFYQQIEPLSPSALEKYHSGDLLSRIRADIDSLNNVYLRIFVPTTVAFFAATIFIVVLSFYDPWFALVEFILLAIAGIGVPWLVNHLGHQTGKAMVTSKAKMRADIVSDVQGMGELLIYGAAQQHQQQLQQQTQQLIQQQQRMAQLFGLSQGAVLFCGNLAMWAILILAIPHVHANTIAKPELVMLTLFALASFEAVIPLPLAFQSLGETLAALRRIFSLVDEQQKITEPKNPLPFPTECHIAFKQVHFAYAATPTLQDISFNIKSGETLAIIGATGSGKSTLTQLLLKLRQVQSGDITINGHSLNQYHSEDLRKTIAVATQQVHLFNSTIIENLKLAKPDASQEEINQACKTALIDDFITHQPDGYQTDVGETGLKISGGQAKRLSIARALLKPASVLILDEPTESLDPENAKQLMQNVFAHAKKHKQSLIVITHRMNEIDQFDKTIVIDQGRIVRIA